MALYLSNTAQYLTSPENMGWVNELLHYPVTFACWWKADAKSGVASNCGIMHVGTNGSTSSYYGLYQAGSVYAHSEDGVTANVALPSADVWYCIAGIWTPTTLNVYMNGSVSAASAISQPTWGASTGRVFRTKTFASNGAMARNICHMAIWTTNLSIKELNSFRLGESPLNIRSESLVDYWPLTSVSPSYEGEARGNKLKLSSYADVAYQVSPRAYSGASVDQSILIL